jgi:predicted  nucleic acid-binding Zn-ribbon protein
VVSQCCSCGHNFKIVSEEVLFCSPACEKKHDLFRKVEREGLALAEPVEVSQLTPEELENYRNQTKNVGLKKKPRRVADWRWPQNRRKNG